MMAQCSASLPLWKISPTMTGVAPLSGYQVFEALAVSEVLYLCEHRNIDGQGLLSGGLGEQ